MARTRTEGSSDVVSSATEGTSNQQFSDAARPGCLRYEMVTGTKRGTSSLPFPETAWREELRVKRERRCRGIRAASTPKEAAYFQLRCTELSGKWIRMRL